MYFRFGKSKVNDAFFMCFVTYAIAMFSLEWFLGDLDKSKKISIPIKPFNIRVSEGRSIKEKRKENELKIGQYTFSIIFILFALGFAIYVKRTGGIMGWIASANNAFFSRGGAGLFYLLFTHTLLILLYFEGQRAVIGWRGHLRRFMYIALLCFSYTFVGSKSTTFMMILVLFADRIMDLDIFDGKSILIIVSGLAVFIVGMVVRLGDLMKTSFATSVNQILNYFDTFESFLIMTKDFSPGLFRTFFLPLNWPLVKLGFTKFSKFYDMSIWMTTEYYPDSWLNGGTVQWPLESDMYMSFFFWGGIPLVILYFAIIAKIYRKAQNKGVWQFIYIIEAFYIISHLRGGFLIFWYYWLIPLYIWLVKKYDRKSTNVLAEQQEIVGISDLS